MIKLNTPTFSAPPINEVVFGASFKNPMLRSVDFGLYYSTIKNEFELYSDHPPVITNPNINMNFSNPLLPRVWFEGKDKSRLIQLQQDKFFYNWRRVEGQQQGYPQFLQLFPEYESKLNNLNVWWSEKFKTPLELKSLELTYTNHIDEKAGWKGIMDNHKIFKFLDTQNISSKYEQFDALYTSSFYSPETDSDVLLSLKRGQRLTDMAIVAVYEITIRERNRGSLAIADWYTNAHNVIIDFFVNTTTKEAQNKWGHNG